MVLPGLDVEAAERHLTNIPLSLNEEKVVERQVSNRTVSKASSLPFVVDTGYIPSSGLDVDAAERFLVSLDVVLWQLTSPERPGRDEFPMFDCEHTVIGGWRDGEALDLMRKGLIGKGLIGGRIVLSTRQSTTYICSSTAVSDAAKFDKTKNYGKEVQIPLIPRARWWFRSTYGIEGTSYATLLVPSESGSYDPFFLDDPTLRQGKHHTVLRLDAYQVSVIPFLRPRRLKEELNDQFRASHPQIHPSMTLSKFRNLQKDLLHITQLIPALDVSTVAMAWVYFEKLVLGNHVRKGNRKLLAGACLVLAFKFNESAEDSTNRQALPLLEQLAGCIRKLDRKDQLNSTALRDAELQVFVWLEFGLHLTMKDVLPHLKRMLTHLGMNFRDYYEGGRDEEEETGDILSRS